MAYQARGIFIGLSAAELAERRTKALARIDGMITSVSEAGGSHTRGMALPPDEVLIEVAYAENAARGTLPPTRTRPDYGGSSDGPGYCCNPARSDYL